MIGRAAAVWLLLLVVAVGAGALRVGLLEPRLGEPRAHVVGTLVVVAVFAALIWRTVGWFCPSRDRSALAAVGVGWAVATVVFEFGFGRYVAGHSWQRLLADYDVFAGRLWPLVLLTLLVMPVVAGEVQRRRLGPRSAR
ncbi:MAG TPA: hypothetical protein VF406_19475 [Thermodesulfobacteriota bacterium]